MASCFGLLVVLVIANGILVPQADALGSSDKTSILVSLLGSSSKTSLLGSLLGSNSGTSLLGSLLGSSSGTPLLGSLLGYLTGSIKDIPKELLNPPRNTNASIQYLLYTPDQPKTPCYLESNLEALKQCPFNPSLPIKFLIHGFLSTIHPGGPFLMIKDEMLKLYQYNVVVVDWSQYNQPPYLQAAFNTVLVAHELANLIHFLQKSAGSDSKKIHLIGHSLGAHVSGAAGERIPNLGRITGLDPAARFFLPITLLHRLTHSDADFVDIIHSSNSKQGFGEHELVGDLDFYPNGGESQPQCQKGSKGTGSLSKQICNHPAAISYFFQSIDSSQCNFLASECDAYSDFLKGLCSNDSTPIAEMGLPAKPIPGLPPKSKFYLRTSPNTPYCLQDGYEPKKNM